MSRFRVIAATVSVTLGALVLGGSSAAAQAPPPPKPPASETAAVAASSDAAAARSATEGTDCAAVKAKLRSTPPAQRPASSTCFEIREPSNALSGGVGARSIQPVSQTCNASANAGTTVYYITRRDMCRVAGWAIDRFDSNGAVTGTVTGDVIAYGYTSDTPNWGHQIQIFPNTFTPGMQGTTVQGSARCTGDCTTQSGAFPRTILVAGQTHSGESYHVTTKTAAGSVGFATSQWLFTAQAPGSTPSPSSGFMDTGSPRVRCDKATPGTSATGCVMPDYVPAVIYSRTGEVAELARHIGDAQASGLPGAYPSGRPLTRLTNRDDALDNRRRACPSSYTRPTGKSCDEYPFASSNQGADQVTGAGRTFSYCQIPQLPQGATGANGYSACMINSSQNSLGGTRLNTFFVQNRVLSADAYRVWIQ